MQNVRYKIGEIVKRKRIDKSENYYKVVQWYE